MKIFVELSLHDREGSDSSLPSTNAPKVAITAPRATVAFASTKGGTGKSTLAVNVAAALALSGRKVGLLDADLNAPSIPAMLGIKPFRMLPMLGGVEPAAGPLGLLAIAANLIPEGEPPPFSFSDTEPETTQVQPPGPVQLDYSTTLAKIAGQIRFGAIDLVIVDLAPGIEHLYRAARLIELSGIVLVSHPSDQAMRSASGAVEIATHLSTPVIGMIENMAGFNCDNCHSVRPLFPLDGTSVQAENAPTLLGRLPFDPRMAESAGHGKLFVKDYAQAPTAKQISELAHGIERALASAGRSKEQSQAVRV